MGTRSSGGTAGARNFPKSAVAVNRERGKEHDADMANILNHGLCLSRAPQGATEAVLPLIGNVDIGPAGRGLRQLLESVRGESFVLVVKDDVWWPLGNAVDGMHVNASFMLAVLQFHSGAYLGDAPELPAGATPGPWWIETANGNGEAAIAEPPVAIVAMSPVGKETLAYVHGRVLAELIVDTANRFAPTDPCF